MKNWKRLLGMVLALIMAIPAAAFAETAEKTYDTEMVFQLASDAINESVDYNADPISEHFRGKFNFKWDIIALASENAKEKIRIWINSGDMPDVVINSVYNHGEYTNYIEQGLLYRFPDDWKDRWPNAAAAYETTVLGSQLETTHGGTYIFPRALFAANKPTDLVVPHYSVYLRKDWAEAVGFELKDAYTTSELMEFARLIKEQDPGGVGSRLVPMSVRPALAVYLFTLANSTFSGGALTAAEFFRSDAGSYQWGPAQPETLEGLKLYKQAYEEGLLHPEFYTYSGSADNEDFYVAGISGLTVMAGMASYYQIADNYFKENLDLSFDEAIHTAAVLGDDGRYHSPELINYAGFYTFSPNISEEKFERYMDLLDYAATEEGQMIIRMGIEGEDWDWGDDGEILSYYAEGESVRTKYPSIYPVYHRIVIMSDDFSLINPVYEKEYRDRVIDIYKLKYDMGKDGSVAPTDWDVALFSSDAMNRLSFDYGLEYAMLVMGDNDIETDWNNWVSANAYMIDPVLEELDAAF
ncbi:ABC transporter substrate-binding protein [Eubacteriales bacterium OttesenSCG-928-A19]|nr:ABC transporter substrate-binding protein [Eubacteriales bacterium OttesenSCG-928-A19]